MGLVIFASTGLPSLHYSESRRFLRNWTEPHAQGVENCLLAATSKREGGSGGKHCRIMKGTSGIVAN